LNNRNLQATFEDLGIAQADLVQAGLLKNPVFDLNVRIPDRSPSKTYLDFSVADSFLDALLIPVRRKLADAHFREVKAKVADEVLNLAAQTQEAFYRYQGAQQMIELRRTSAAAADAALGAAQKLHEAGNISDLDYTSQQAQEARARIELANAIAEADEERETLNGLMGLWGRRTGWKIGGHLPDLPATEIDSKGLEVLAITQRLDLAAAGEEVVVQARALGITVQTRFFTDVDAGVEAERETDGQWRIGPTISAPLPIFDQGQAAIAKGTAQLRQSKERYLALAVAIGSQVRAARTRLFNARAKALFYRDQLLPLQQQLLAETQRHYNGMFVGVFQLLQAKRDQTDAAREYIEACRDYWIARAELERAMGGRLPTGAAAASQPSTKPAAPGGESHGD
jgi:cobalt-zinc-cadmium efflux system outer membrane protein